MLVHTFKVGKGEGRKEGVCNILYMCISIKTKKKRTGVKAYFFGTEA